MPDVADSLPLDLSITRWVEEARANQIVFRDRRVTHILLAAIGLTPVLQQTMVLKGGTLMMLAFGSPRGTQDVDFTIAADPEPFASELETRLNPALQRAAAELGYVDLVCKVQRVTRRPKPETFESGTASALCITIAHARRGSNEERLFAEGRSSRVLQVDLSFKEPLLNTAEAKLEQPSVSIRAYALEDLIAEKFRALLQQHVRNGGRRVEGRRQDVFDLAWLSDHTDMTDDIRARILSALIEKSFARGIEVSIESIDDPEVSIRSSNKWNTLQEELDSDLPPFEEAFEKTRDLYRSLPWNNQ
jgi:predicted nucleotidyltransferase component of viral defense system